MKQFGLDGVQETGIASAQGQEVNFGPEMILKIAFQAHEIVENRRRAEFDQDIDVAVGVCVATSAGTEQPEVFDIMLLDLRPQSSESLSDCEFVADHRRKKVTGRRGMSSAGSAEE